ncbi:Cell-division control histidine kinase PdhS [Hartmannibacter diazotrophicus]|uniref:histidine kinase n=1 Tax=Hartmannibacter diazotrophicus TaxID=1482074 RepID=A0A2C9D287_9HYPH|nr:ATP-binding protein [Hartmannibacter diazotrophicus]SON54487.1 Cell-division control histidine kinase PdhS [Hartmannibacter diazotrophicus]
MVERSDQFRTLNSDAALVPLKSNVRPAFVLDRTGRRVLWANAAGLSFHGVETLTDLANQTFSPDQPFVTRAGLLAGNLAEGAARLEKLRFPGRFRAMPYTCQVKSLKLAAPDGSAQKALLVTMLDGPAFGGSAAEAENRLATFLATDSVPETWPDAAAAILPEDESAAIDVVPAVDEAPADIGGTEATVEVAPDVDEPAAEVPAQIIEAGDIDAPAEAAAEDAAAFASGAMPAEETAVPASTEMVDAEASGPADVADVSLAEADQFTGDEDAQDIAIEVAAATLSDDALPFSVDNVADDLGGHAQPDEQPAAEILPSEASAPVEAEDRIGETVEAELPAENAAEQIAEDSAFEAAPEAESPVLEPVEGLDDAETAAALAAEADQVADIPSEDVAPTDDTGTGAVDAGGLETASSAPFAFAAHDRPVRFVFELDEATRFGFVSPELAETIGPLASPSLGESWDEAAERLRLDAEGKVTKALGRRDTFTGATVRWPVQDADFAVTVGLSGMPVFGRDRSFRGYRGFGICRTGETFATDGVIVPTTIPATTPETTEPEAAENLVDEAGSALAEIASPTDAADMTSEASEAIAQQDLAMSEELAVDETPAPEAFVSAESIEEDAPAEVAGAETEETGQAVVDEIAPETVAELDASNEAASADEAMSATEGMVEALPPDVVFAPDEAVEDITLTPEDPATSEPASLIGTADTEAAAATDEGIGAPASDADDAPDMPQPAAGGESATSTQPDFFLGSMPISLDDARSAIRAAGKGNAGESDTGTPVETVSVVPGDAPEERPADGEATSSAPEADASADSRPSAVESDDDARGAPAPASTSTPAVTAARPALVQQQAPSAKVIPSPMIARPVPVPMTDGKQLSRPEREAFRQIAEALGARYEGPTGEDEAPAPTQRATGYTTTTVARNARAANAPSGATLDVSVIERLPVALAIFKDGNLISMNSAFLALCGYDSRADFEAAGGIDAVITDDVFTTAGNPIKLRVAKNQEIAVNVTIHKIQHNGAPASMMVFDRRASSAEANGEKAVEAPAPSPVAPTAEASQDSASEALLQRTLDAETRIGELDAILDTATDGVLVIDGQGEILNCNRSAEALFGQEKANIIGRRLVDILAPESHRSALDYLDGLARNGVASVLNDGREVIGTVGSGGYIPLFMTMGRVGADKFCAVLRDITHWKRVEEELTSAKRQAETASSQKSEFLAKMSHEIRTPLNAIIGFSEVMMEERFGPVGNERYKEYLRDIRLSGTHIMSLVNDLLDLSKIEAGKMDLSFTAVSINDILRDCVALMQPQANRERIIIRTSLSSTVPHVVADERSVRQIVLNLLSNAIKFTPQSGQVIVSTIYDDTGEVAVRVRDTGDGMSAAEIQKALEPFRQLHTARSGSGTGLGLPLTKALVEANRAHFRIESAPGQGTLVEITFPSTRVLAE